jgi:hypothetical protein
MSEDSGKAKAIEDVKETVAAAVTKDFNDFDIWKNSNPFDSMDKIFSQMGWDPPKSPGPRNFTISVKFEDGGNGCRADCNPRSGVYNIVISPKQLERLKISISTGLAHELGHVIGYALRLPRTEYANNLSSVYSRYADNEMLDKAVVAQEMEAWDQAEEILNVRQRMTRSYRIHRQVEDLWGDDTL